MIKNFKRTLSILLCYIFVVMMLPVNLITNIVQASTNDVPDYSNVLESGYAYLPVLYKDKAIINVGSAKGYKYYENGEMKINSSDKTYVFFNRGYGKKVEVKLERGNKTKYYYDFETEELIEYDIVKSQIQKVLNEKISKDGIVVRIDLVNSTDNEVWYNVEYQINEEILHVLINEDYTISINNKLYDDRYLQEIWKYGENFINVTQKYDHDISEYKLYIERISLNGEITTINSDALNEYSLWDLEFRGDTIYYFKSSSIKIYKIIEDKVVLDKSIELSNLFNGELSEYPGISVDIFGHIWFVGAENNKTFLYKLEENVAVKKYKINDLYSNGDYCSIDVYDENNIVLRYDMLKHTIIQNSSKNGWVYENSKWYYYNDNGSLVKGWMDIDGTWYHFDNNGAMETGWQQIGGVWYYFNESGAMATGWNKVDGTWYYFNAGGDMATGWLSQNGTWYYLNNSGAMLTGWQSIDGIWYYFDNSGVMATGWLQLGGTWYYLNNSGEMLTGWQSIDGTWYYFDNSGVMATGWLQLGSTWYYLYNSGAMATNTVIDGWYIDGNGVAMPQ